MSERSHLSSSGEIFKLRFSTKTSDVFNEVIRHARVLRNEFSRVESRRRAQQRFPQLIGSRKFTRALAPTAGMSGFSSI